MCGGLLNPCPSGCHTAPSEFIQSTLRSAVHSCSPMSRLIWLPCLFHCLWKCPFKYGVTCNESYVNKVFCSTIDWLRLSYTNTWVTRPVPIEHPRSLAHVTLLDLDKQGESSRPLPEAMTVWREFTWVTDSQLLHKKLIKHYTTQSFKYAFIMLC